MENASPLASPPRPAIENSYGQIFKSTALTGGASVINVVLGIARTKIIAVLLGPSGVGLSGIYTTILGLVGTIAGLGIGYSGVRQIAEAAAIDNQFRIARTIRILQCTSLVLGLAGALLLAAASHTISVLMFGDTRQVKPLAILGLAVFFGTVSSGQIAVFQGLRRISDLALSNVLSALVGTMIGLPLIWNWGIAGIVPMLVMVSATGMICSWFLTRKLLVGGVKLSWFEATVEARSLLGMGIAFMVSSLMTAVVTWLIRLLVLRQLGIDAAGYYTAAYTISGIYAGFILQAMGADFYPRLAAVANDHRTINRMVNEQTEIALLMAVPGVLVTLVLAPWVIRLLYAGEFDPAVDVLRWQVLGILGRVISWPMGFVQIARGQKRLFLATEFLGNLMYVGLIWWGINCFGLLGTGMAFAAMYVFYTGLIMTVCAKEIGFRWSQANRNLISVTAPSVLVVFVLQHKRTEPTALTLSIIVTIIISLLYLYKLLQRLPKNKFGTLRRLL